MQKGIAPDSARDMLLALPLDIPCETVQLFDAMERVLAEDIHARLASPPFDRSPYDGYAFRGEDTSGASKDKPVTLRVTEEIPAGTMPTVEVTSGTAAKILTGAPIPPGANATIKYEQTEFTADEVKLFAPVAPNTDIVYAGEDVMPGTVLAQRGDVVTAPLLGVMASQGIAQVRVFRRPVVSIVTTGSELVEVGSPCDGAKIYNSNVYTLHGYLSKFGVQTRNGGTCVDEPDEIASRISGELEHADMVITTGGASVGDYDWALTAAERIGAEILFWKTAMKPGGAVMAATHGGKVILSLSGNPGAAVLGLLRIGLPYIRRLCGRADIMPEEITVTLKKPVKKASPRMRMLRGRLEICDGKAVFNESDGQGNGSVSSLVGCDLLGEVPPGSPPLPAGAEIKAYRV